MKPKSIKGVKSLPEDDLRAEYRREDLGKGVRGKYYQAYTKGTNAEGISRTRKQTAKKKA